METSVILSLGDRTKSIPSPSAACDSPGFILLKGRIDAVPTIPETEGCDALKRALATINDGATPFFTAGCGKSFNSDQDGHWARGYIAFAFNYLELAKDSPNYYLLFEQFNAFIKEAKFNLPVDFNFEIRRAEFTAVPAAGHLARVWITTSAFPAMELAQKLWNQSVGFLADFLGSYEKPPLPPIFES